MTLLALYIFINSDQVYTPRTLLDAVNLEKRCLPENEDQVMSLFSGLLEELVSEHMAERIKTEDGEDAYRAIRPFDRVAYLDKGGE
jgi:hypothetical protein